jgi:hypothetical protein
VRTLVVTWSRRARYSSMLFLSLSLSPSRSTRGIPCCYRISNVLSSSTVEVALTLDILKDASAMQQRRVAVDDVEMLPADSSIEVIQNLPKPQLTQP